MKKVYEERLEKLIQNYEEIRSRFKWENDNIRHMIALAYAMEDKELDTALIKEVQTYIKSETGAFSPYRGHKLLALSGLLCASSDNSKDQFKSMLNNEKAFKSVGFKNPTYYPIALYTLSSVYKGDDVSSYLEKAMSIYKDMRKNHPFLTSGDDYALAILLAGTDHSTDILEEYYRELNSRGFSKSNGLQMLSHIMAFSEKSVYDSADRCERIYNYLRRNKLKIYTNYYPAIGLVSILDINEDELNEDLVQIVDFLRSKKRYKYLGKGMNILIASAIISSGYIEEKSANLVDTTISTLIQNIIAAQQAAMIAAVAGSAGASASTGT